MRARDCISVFDRKFTFLHEEISDNQFSEYVNVFFLQYQPTKIFFPLRCSLSIDKHFYNDVITNAVTLTWLYSRVSHRCMSILFGHKKY